MASEKNRTDLIDTLIKVGAANDAAVFEAELARIENMTGMLHESELAPGPDQGSLGLHPSSIPQQSVAESPQA